LSSWRELGLVSRRLVFDGRKRVGFLRSSVDRFVKTNQERVVRGSRFSQLTDEQRQDIINKTSAPWNGNAYRQLQRVPLVIDTHGIKAYSNTERYSFIGRDLPGRSYQLKTTAWMKPAELFAASAMHEETREPLFYAQSWALAQTLIVSPAYAPRFPAFLSMVALGSPSQIIVSILDSNPPPVSGTRVIFPSEGANYASTLDIKLRVANSNVARVKLYSEDQLLASFTSAPPILTFVTNFSVGAHTIYSVQDNFPTGNNVTSAPVHFQVLAPLAHNPLTPKLGIAPEANASFFLDSNGALFDWGDGRFGALADGGFTNQEQNTVTRPIQIPLPAGTNRFAKVSSGSRHTLALTSDGSLYTCGDNSSGQTGTGHSTSIFEGFVTIPEAPGTKDIAAGNLHSLALSADGRLRACGNNSFGQLGLGNITNSSVFRQVPFPTGVTAWTAIGAGSNYSIALANNGRLYACGLGFFGTLGTGGTTNSTIFAPVSYSKVTRWETSSCSRA